MRILIAGYFATPRHEDAWCRALSDLGHKVGEFRMLPYLRLNKTTHWFQNRYLVGPLLHRINRDLLVYVRSFQPDVFVGYRALLLHPKTIQHIKEETGAVLACYQNDNVFGPLGRNPFWRHFKRAIPLYDVHYVFREADIKRFVLHGAKRAHLLRHQYLPWLHRRLDPMAYNGLESDVCFVGHCEPDARVDQVDHLMRSVPAIYRLHGFSWSSFAKGRAWEGMSTPDVLEDKYVRVLNAAKICLAFNSTWNEDTYTTRHFEIPACGGFMLSQRTEDLLSLYREDTETVFFSDTEELIDKCRYYLEHEEERQKIAEAGWKRCITSGYDVHSRMKEFLDPLQELI